MTGLLVAAGVAVGILLAVWFAKHTKHPEQTAGHEPSDASFAGDRSHQADDRPAGPDAEDVVGPADPRDPAYRNDPPA